MKIVIFLMLIIPLTAYTHETVSPNECPKPANTGRITSQMEHEMLQAELILYEGCMFNYIREQQSLSDVHQQAAQKTLDEWNDYLMSRMQ